MSTTIAMGGAYLQPISDAVLTKFPGMAVRYWGPQGIGATSTMVVYDPAYGDDVGAICWLQFRHDSSTTSCPTWT